MSKLPALLLIFLILLFLASPFVSAVASSCSASVSPTSVNISTSVNLTFTVNNTDSVSFVWVKLTTPSGNFTITSASASGWSASTTSSTATFTSGSLSAGASTIFTASTTIGSSTASAAQWTIQVSDSSGGTSPYTCSGTATVEIVSTDSTSPTHSNLTVSDISDTSAKISWSTDEATTSTVSYGTTTAYGSSTTTSSATSHSVTLTSLSANTTYHYNIVFADSAGNDEETGDNTFVTAKTTTTVTVTKTQTVNKTVTETVTETVTVEDTTKPEVGLTTDFSKFFSQAPLITGSAKDDVGVSKIEYSQDDGLNWLPVDNIAEPNAKTTSFDFTPTGLLDGNYEIRTRVTDPSGNVEISPSYTLIIDRLPPIVGAALYSFGSQVLIPNKDGVIFTLPNLEQKVTIPAVGGPTEINLVSETQSPESLNLDPKVLGFHTEDAKNQTFSLVKDIDTGLWTGVISFTKEGIYRLKVVSVDGVENKTESYLSPFVVLPRGKVTNNEIPISGATVSLYYFEATLARFVLWNGAPYGINNPQKTDASGHYHFTVPAGKYYLEIKAPGFQNAISSIFESTDTTILNSDFPLSKIKSISIFGNNFYLPSFFAKEVEFTLTQPKLDQELKITSELKGSDLPFFTLGEGQDIVYSTNFRGKPTLLTFTSTWLPQTSEQMSILQKISTDSRFSANVIVVQEGSSKVEIFKKRGGYELPVIADPDGKLVDLLKINSIPYHIFINRKGTVISVKVGVLGEEEIKEQLTSDI